MKPAIGLRVLLILIVTWFAAGACFLPFDEEILLHVKDGVLPSITILAPTDGSAYAATIVVQGRVSDASTEEGDPGSIRSLTYSLDPAFVDGGEVPFDADGSFSFSFATAGFSGNVILSVRTEDWNGNPHTTSITLVKASSDIPSLTATSGNHSVTLEWAEVPLSTSYTLYYTTNGNHPSETYGFSIPDVTTSVTLQGLANGALHVFLLRSHSSSGSDNWSDFVESIPLSPYTLTPTVKSEYRRIRLSWPSIPATDQFEVWRATEEYGSYTNISGTVTGNELIDTDVDLGLPYHYRISPAGYAGVLSVSTIGVACPFPRNPVLRTVPITYPGRLHVSASYAVVTSNSGCIKIYGIGDVMSPRYLSTVWMTNPNDVAIVGNYIYVADGIDGVRVVDNSSPQSASVIHTITGMSNVRGICADGNYVYAASSDGGLRVIDATNPTSAGVVKTVPVAGSNGQDVVVADGYAYMADLANGLRVIDIDPLSSAHLVQTVAGSDAVGVTVAGDYAYLSREFNGLDVIDIHFPDSAFYTHTIPDYTRSAAASGSYLYLAGDVVTRLRVADISVPETASVVRTVNQYADDPLYLMPTDVEIVGDLAYATSNNQGSLHVVDIHSPLDAKIVHTVDTTSAKHAVSNGSHLFVADGFGGIRILDISSPEGAFPLESVTTLGGNDVAMSGDYLFVADGVGGLGVIDVGSITDASVVHNVPSSSAYGVAISGDYAYVIDSNDGFLVIDISTPKSASTVAALRNLTGTKVSISGSLAFVAAYTAGLRIVDIGSPTDPVEIGNYDTTNAVDVEVVGDYAYVIDSSAGLVILDVSDPRSIPSAVTIAQTDAGGVDVAGDFLYLANGTGGMRIYNIEDPLTPVLVQTVPSTDAYGSCVAGGYAYLADGTSGIRVIDLWPY